MARFVVDAQLPPVLADRLTGRGHPSEHVNRIRLGASADDEIWSYVARRGASLITKDEDFVTLARSSALGPQVVWVRLGNITNAALWRSIEPALPEIIEAIEAGERVVEVL